MQPNDTEALVNRYEITAQLNKATRAKVTFISALIGYGKTTSVNMWAYTLSIQKIIFAPNKSGRSPAAI